MRSSRIVPVIIGCGLFMQQLDSTALATALPDIAASLHQPPLRLHLAITSYLLAMAVFLPISGWMADRFGAKNIFRLAILLFTVGSVFCGLTSHLQTMVAARIVQGIGGSMMVPVGRIILVRSFDKSELVSAMVLMSMTAVVGPAMGPLLGGIITTFISWRWIFWINVPAGIAGIILTTIFIDHLKTEEVRKFDFPGFILTGAGLGCLLFGVDTIDLPGDAGLAAKFCVVGGIAALAGFIIHHNRAHSPILDLTLFRFRSFRIAVVGGLLFRTGMGALPFLLPLLMQVGFGYSPLQSGAITFISAAGAFGMRAITKKVLKFFGFRNVLVYNAGISALSIGCIAFFTPTTPRLLMMGAIFFGGVFRTLEFTAVNAIAYEEVPSTRMSDATTLTQMGLRISQSIGVAIAALVLGIAAGVHKDSTRIPLHAFTIAFLVMGAIALTAGLSFMGLPANAGEEMAGRGKAAKPAA